MAKTFSNATIKTKICSINMKFEMDFYYDWINILQSELINFGYQLPELSQREIAIAYYNFKKRLIEPRKRSILKSNNFICPSGYEIGLNTLESKIKLGEDLMSYLSKKIMQHDYNDPMLNHWGIYHLHLGENVDISGFIERTRPVLYVKFDSNFAYFIGIKNHGEWSNKELIQIIHDNWSNTLPNNPRDDVEMAFSTTNEVIKKLRKLNINHSLEMNDGAIYIQADNFAGVTTDGNSTEVVMRVLSMERQIKEWQKLVELNIASLVEDALNEGLSLNSGVYEINLCYVESKPFALEKNKLFGFELI